MTIRLIVICTVLLVVLVAPAAGQEETTVVTVTNGGNAINGDTSSIVALIAAPGADGISFAEAVEAANGTFGPKLLNFAPDLVRNPIDLVPDSVDRRFIVLQSGRLTIDGDVDGDGKPDITLVARADAVSASFVIRSSGNTIRGLNLVTFPEAAIIFMCLTATCEDQGIFSTRIENNSFLAPRGAGIIVAPSGIRPTDTPYVPDVVFDGLIISGNEFTVRDTAISIVPGYGGLQHVSARGVTIANNRITAGWGIEVVAGGHSAQPYFSDFNSIDGLTIEHNTFQECATAISIAAGNWSGSDDAVRHVRISENEFLETKNGVQIAAGIAGIPQRSGDRNVVDDVVIASNRMAVTETGITITAGGAPAVEGIAFGYASNAVRNVSIDGNTISGFSGTAVRVWGGFAGIGSGPITATDNTVQGLTISDNELQPLELAQPPVGIALTAGDAASGGTAQRNSIRDVTIAGNRFTGPGVFLQLIGGSGPAAKSNTVDFPRIGSNTWQSVVPLTTSQNANGASGNTIAGIVRRRAVKR